jgi:hypothetical protein
VIERWSCESYCLCGSRKGHFEKSETGVWVLYESHAKLLSARLQQVEGYKVAQDLANVEIVRLHNLLTACQLERDALERKCSALAVLVYPPPNSSEP